MRYKRALLLLFAVIYGTVIVVQFHTIQQDGDGPVALDGHDVATDERVDWHSAHRLDLTGVEKTQPGHAHEESPEEHVKEDKRDMVLAAARAAARAAAAAAAPEPKAESKQDSMAAAAVVENARNQSAAGPKPAAAKRPKQNLNKRSECQLSSAQTVTYSDSSDHLLDSIPFADPHGGAWTQGFEITYDQNEWADSPLHVHLVPHSHNDPGWLKTVDQYFTDQTTHIISNVVDALNENPKRTFIWAETSYFSMWFDAASKENQERAKRVIASGQLEIVNGGWVMPDEANSHYFALVDQLIEGHQYLFEKVGVKPSRGWSIDPFGQSPTMAYILHRAGYDSMLIQRVHYEIKHALAQAQKMEFSWLQEWDRDQGTGIFCHMMPFFSYDVPHTCGPNPKVCCQFDFARMFKFGCPWGVPPVPITSENLKERAELLVDQYRKKSKLYRSKHVLIPLGDDFRYTSKEETTAQYENYQKLFDYINSNKYLNVVAQFSTLSNYFKAATASPELSGEKLPTFAGDFFTYADRQDNYWSGYYSSRPYYKYLDRVLEYSLRRVEILHSLAIASKTLRPALSSDYTKLVECRRALALFQHHDGITGTAKDPVVVDYGMRLVDSINKADLLSAKILEMMFAGSAEQPSPVRLKPFSRRPGHDMLPEVKPVSLKESSRWVTVFNSLGHARDEMVHFRISSPDVKIQDANGEEVVSQVNPVWTAWNDISQTEFDVWFEASLPALGAARYLIVSGKGALSSKATIQVRSQSGLSLVKTSIFENNKEGAGQDILFTTSQLSVTFDGQTGLIKKLDTVENGDIVSTVLNLRFMYYGSRPSGDRSGAYLFLPSGPAQSYEPSAKPSVQIIEGPLVRELRIQFGSMHHEVRVFESPSLYAAAIWIRNVVDVRAMDNKEFVMRFETDLNSERTFYTDLNGFQMRKRRYMEKLKMQGNFYPLPTMAFLEDDKRRFSLHTRSAMGAASLSSGWLEVVLDRRLMQDDARGLEQGVVDNRVTEFHFAIHVELRAPASVKSNIPNPTSFGHRVNDLLNHPPFKAIADGNMQAVASNVKLLQNDLPCDVHILNLRTLQGATPRSALILHRKGQVCEYLSAPLGCNRNGGIVNVLKLFTDTNIASAKEKTLSLMHEQPKDRIDLTSYRLLPSELHTFELTWTA